MSYTITEIVIKNIVSNLASWSDNQESFRIKDFCQKYEISYDKFRFFVQNSRPVREAYYKIKPLLDKRKNNRKKAIKQLTQTEIDKLLANRRNQEV